MTDRPNDWIERALRGQVIVDIGQIDDATRKALNRETITGSLTKWRGYWAPIAGASFGVGPLKTCYGTAAAKQALP